MAHNNRPDGQNRLRRGVIITGLGLVAGAALIYFWPWLAANWDDSIPMATLRIISKIIIWVIILLWLSGYFNKRKSDIAKRKGIPNNQVGLARSRPMPLVSARPRKPPSGWAEAAKNAEAVQLAILKTEPPKIETVTVPAGEFIMGLDGGMREDPAHPVTLAEYQIGRYPITNAQYLHFVRDTGHQKPEHWTRHIHYGESRNLNHPVVRVSWYDAVAYCNWLSQKTGKNYRLPTEAEWEKAARGHDGRHYPWGDEFEADRCNCMRESVIVAGRVYEIGGPSPAGTTPVGYYSPQGDSPYGVADMAGNVWEWCATKWLKPYPYDTTENEWSEVYLEGYTSRVRRGGSFGDICSDARATSRYRSVPLNKYGNLGFRVVVSLNGGG